MHWSWVTALACAFAISLAHAQTPETPPAPAPVAHIGFVQWETRPTAQEFAAVYPAAAYRQGLDGRATLDCMIGDDRHLTCTIHSENPPGAGFGEAAMAVSPRFLAAPTNRDGVPVVGRRTLLHLRFMAQPGLVAAPFNMVAFSRAIERHYPEAARAAHIGGKATIDCLILERRRQECTIVSEEPTGYGFGQAALNVANERSMRPSRNAVVGSHSALTIEFAPR